MAYFPMFMDMIDLKVLVVGGGAIATEKLEKLLDFTTEITVIALRVDDEALAIIDEHALVLHKRAYDVGDIKGFDIVIVATDTQVLHKEIYEESRGSRTLVNSVDNTAYVISFSLRMSKKKIWPLLSLQEARLLRLQNRYVSILKRLSPIR